MQNITGVRHDQDYSCIIKAVDPVFCPALSHGKEKSLDFSLKVWKKSGEKAQEGMRAFTVPLIKNELAEFLFARKLPLREKKRYDFQICRTG